MNSHGVAAPYGCHIQIGTTRRCLWDSPSAVVGPRGRVCGAVWALTRGAIVQTR